MDAYAPTLMAQGVRGMIGKGQRNQAVIDAIEKYKCIYFGAIGGAGALLSKCVKSNQLIDFEDLGAEALCRLYVEDMPLVVVIDSYGNNLYISGREDYLAGKK
jgi:fumarate hydratase subunit beta